MKLLIAMETTERDEVMLGPAGELGRAAGADVVLLNVVNPMADAIDIVAPTREEAVRKVVAERAAHLDRYAGQFDPPATVLVEELRHGEDEPECIARVAGQEQADILVIATNRASGMRGLILGSVAQHLLRLAPCPILVVRVD